MTRIAPLAALASLAVITFGAHTRDALVGAYAMLSMTCMTLSGAIRVRADTLALVAAAMLGLVAVVSACRQWLRTARAVRALRLLPAAESREKLARIASTLGVDGRIEVAGSDSLFAFCHGMRRPRLIVSAALVDTLPDDELEAVLRHEAAHLRRRDPLRILVARSCARAFAFIPLAPVMLEAYLCRREIEADHESTAAMGDVLPLAGALQRMLASAPAPAFASLAVGALTATDVRIDRLLGDETSPRLLTKVSRLHVLLFTVAVAVLTCVLIATAHAATGVQPCVPC